MKRLILVALGFLSILTVGFSADTPRNNPAPAYTVTKLPVASGADFFQPHQINNRGDILGHLDFSMGPFIDDPHAAFFSGGATIDLHLLTPDAATFDSSLPVGLNNQGQAIFFVYGQPLPWQFFLYDDGQLVDLNALYEHNDLDFLLTLSGETNFVYGGGQVRLLDSGAPDEELPVSFHVAGINHRGDAVGWSISPQISDAMLYSGGRTYNLHDLIDPVAGWHLINAYDINDHGQIVGWGRVDGNWAGFLLDPIRPAR